MEPMGIAELVKNKEFEAIWREINSHYVSRSDLEGMAMPDGMSCDEVYEIVERLMCLSGIELPFRPYVVLKNPSHVWISLTNEVRTRIDYITRMAGAVSDLSAYLRRSDVYLQVPLAMDELVTVCRLDGFDITPRRASALWSGAEKPVSDDDRAFELLCQTYVATKHYAHRAISRGFIEAIHEHFMEAMGEEWNDMPPASRQRLTKADYINDDYYSQGTTLDTVASILADHAMPAVVAALQSQLFMLDLKPYREFNHATSLIVHKVFYEQSGFPLLAFVPFSTAMQRWAAGSYDLDLTDSASLLEMGKVDGVGLDATPFTSTALFLIQAEVDKLQAAISAQKAQIECIEEKIRQDPDLNIRQKSGMVHLLHHPRSIILIEEYRDAHGVSYSTARKDLLDLVTLGYLCVRKDPGATSPFTFTIGKKLLLFAYREQVPFVGAPAAGGSAATA